MKEELLRQQKLLETVVNKSFDALLIIDAAGVVRFANPAAIDMFADTTSELVGHHIGTPVAGEATEIVIPGKDKLIQAEFRTTRIDWQGSPAFLANLRDVTAHKEMETNCRQLAHLVNNSRDAIIGLAPDGTILSWNKGARRIYGYSAEEAVGRDIVMLIPETGRDDWRDIMARIITEQQSYEFKTERLARDGKRIKSWLTVSPVIDETENLIGFSTIERDITRQLDLEAQLQQAQKMESIGRLAGGVAHDYNNMLNIIIGYADMALNDLSPDAPLYEELKEILDAAQRSAEITRKLLAFARKQEITPQVMNINRVVEGMLKMLRRLIGEDVRLVWEPGSRLWPVLIDPSQVDQILANLCVNARDAIPGTGHIIIGTKNVELDQEYCSRHRGLQPGEYVQLEINDNGTGMDQEVLVHAFEPFFTTKQIGKGTGLGLATVYGIVKQNSGYINIYSEPERGTTVRIYFPRQRGKMIETGAETKPSSAVSGSGETVLVVEDNEIIMELCRKMLGSLGYQVLEAPSPSRALEVVTEYDGAIDLLLSDVVLPEMSSSELAEKLRAARPGLKVLFMSGYSSSMVKKQGILAADANFIQKPFTKKTLAEKIREALAQ